MTPAFAGPALAQESTETVVVTGTRIASPDAVAAAPLTVVSAADITQTKADYYRLLQAVRTDSDWQAWVLYMLDAVAETAQTTLALVEGIRSQMASVKKRLRDELPNLYSQDLLNNLFRHPYTRIEFVVKDLGVSRQTAAKYLDLLAERDFVAKHRSGRANYYVNEQLVRLFLDVSGGR